MPEPYLGWVIPLLEPGNWTLSVRLLDYDVPDIVDRDNQRVPLDSTGKPPAWAKCYNDTIGDGEHSFEVLPASADVNARLRENVARLPSAIRTADIESAGTLVNTSCSSRSDVLAGSWSSAAEGGRFQAFSGCDLLSTARDAVSAYIARSPDTSIKWVRFIGDSNTRMLVKDNIPWINLLLPPGLYPVELPNGRGTPPCIYGFNPVHGKDEQYLCVLRLGSSNKPTLVSYEWFSLSPLDSGRFGRVDPAYNVTHTVETLLAPFPDLLDLEYADHTLISLGSHRTEATTAEWQAYLDSLTSMWPRSRRHAGLVRPGQPEREDLTLINTTPIDAGSIPVKFGAQHLVRNNRRIEARNALLQQHLTTNAQLQSSQRYPPAQAFLFDLYGMLLPLMEVQHDPVASEAHDKDPILQSSLTFFSDESVESLSPSELLLLQFNSRRTSVSLASAAAERFLALSHAAHDRVRLEPAVALLAVQKCRSERGGGGKEWREKAKGVILRVEEDGVSVVRREEDKRALLRFNAGDIQNFVYLAGADDGTDSMQCTLVLQLARRSLGPLTTFNTTGRPPLPPVRSDKVPAPTKDPEGFASSGPSGFSAAGARRASDSASTQERAAKKRDSDEGSSSSRDSKKRRSSEGSAGSFDIAHNTSGIAGGTSSASFQPSLSEVPANYYPRQIARLYWIAPAVEISAPNFDPDELVLLSRLADPAKLPVLPQHAADPNPDRKHVPTERLGIEHIYHDTVKSVDLNVTRRILFGNDYPDLASYAVLTSKLIQAHDAVALGYDQVRQHRLYPRRTDSTCIDPIDKLIELVEKMRDNTLYRRHILLDSDGALTRKNPLNEIDVGVGPHRRFCRALAEIVKYEREAGAIGQTIDDSTPGSLLSFPLDFPLPPFLVELKPSQLVLMQSNSRCTSSELAAAAGKRFLELAAAAAAELDEAGRAARLELRGFEVVSRDGSTVLGGGQKSLLEAQVAEGDLSVWTDGTKRFSIAGSAITECCYTLEPGNDPAAPDCIVSLRLSRLSLPHAVHDYIGATVKFDLGSPILDDLALANLRDALCGWSEKPGFEVSVSTAPPADYAPADDGSLTAIWRFVGTEPALIEWHPGFYIRQFAFLRSLAPYEEVDAPEFSFEELAILSCKADKSRLPPLPLDPPFIPERLRHVPTERLAPEAMYRAEPRLKLDQTRYVLLTDAFPAVRAYARLLAKIVAAHEALIEAYDRVLETRLYRRAKDKTTHDPIDSLIPLVEKLRNDRVFRRKCFTDRSDAPCRRSHFHSEEVGTGPSRRYKVELNSIVRYEDKVLRAVKQGHVG
ncbi:uncharacterized protein JCM10292_007076 [Rhodotorula paludigena]|uniref:uncharacterized protein n=1 Tax=Rhodotorula paludigena TaxID=86838 RepID=UPI003171E5FC